MPTPVRVPDDVVLRSFEGETVVLNLTTGQYHGLNPTGGRLLELLREEGDVETAAARAADEYGVEGDRIRADLEALCVELADRGLIELGPPGES